MRRGAYQNGRYITRSTKNSRARSYICNKTVLARLAAILGFPIHITMFFYFICTLLEYIFMACRVIPQNEMKFLRSF